MLRAPGAAVADPRTNTSHVDWSANLGADPAGTRRDLVRAHFYLATDGGDSDVVVGQHVPLQRQGGGMIQRDRALGESDVVGVALSRDAIIQDLQILGAGCDAISV